MRRVTLMTLAIFAMLLVTSGAAAAGDEANPKALAEIATTFTADCSGVSVSSTKDISFVEIRFADGTVVTDETMRSADFAYAGAAVIDTLTVKSGRSLETFTCLAVPPDPGEDN